MRDRQGRVHCVSSVDDRSVVCVARRAVWGCSCAGPFLRRACNRSIKAVGLPEPENAKQDHEHHRQNECGLGDFGAADFDHQLLPNGIRECPHLKELSICMLPHKAPPSEPAPRHRAPSAPPDYPAKLAPPEAETSPAKLECVLCCAACATLAPYK